MYAYNEYSFTVSIMRIIHTSQTHISHTREGRVDVASVAYVYD
jgi:hypothetical protein